MAMNLTKILTVTARLIAVVCIMLLSGVAAQNRASISAKVESNSTPSSPAQSAPAQPTPSSKGTPMTKHASGTFEVKVTPQKPDNPEAEASNLGRMSLDKKFRGDLDGTSKGEMLAAMSAVKGSAGYVAMELVNGVLGGRSGTFVLQHRGTMTRGVPQLSVTVVPDSGTGDLAGLTGSMTIKIEEEGKHFYEFEYQLP
jgi:hypothetical protein